MDVLPAARYNVNYFVQLSTLRSATISNTLVCTLHNCSSIKARFSLIQARTACYKIILLLWEKIRVRLACMHIVFIKKSIFLNIFKTKHTTKTTSVSYSVLLEACPQPCCKRSMQIDTILYYCFHIKEVHFEMF